MANDDREVLAKRIKEFLAAGGKIQKCPPQTYADAFDPKVKGGTVQLILSKKDQKPKENQDD